MILQKEIRTIAEKLKVPANTIDKDYVLGHFLNELFKQQWAIDNFLFKGGTCLKKCYFEQYRFSEDIDITVTNPNFALTSQQMESICRSVTQKIGIFFKIIKFNEVLFQDKMVGWDVEICFLGANHNKSMQPVFGKDCHTKIWFDIRLFENLLFPSVQKPLIHLFSDTDLIGVQIPCYSLHEVLAEKMRSLIQRNRGEARDYFDLWYIKTNVADIDWEMVKMAFVEKCRFKAVEFNGVDDFFKPERLKQVETTWEKRLNHQLPQKTDREFVINDLKNFFTNLFL
jgi:predicted nucleotidyltransferase component of viral defense system